jgi:hypothetical protein
MIEVVAFEDVSVRRSTRGEKQTVLDQVDWSV